MAIKPLFTVLYFQSEKGLESEKNGPSPMEKQVSFASHGKR